MTPDPSNDPTIRTGEDSAAEVFEHPLEAGRNPFTEATIMQLLWER